IESAEIANRGADIRVVDVAVDVVGAIRLRMQSPADRIRRPAERVEVLRVHEADAFLERQALAGAGLVEAFLGSGFGGGRGHPNRGSGVRSQGRTIPSLARIVSLKRHPHSNPRRRLTLDGSAVEFHAYASPCQAQLTGQHIKVMQSRLLPHVQV